MISRSTSGKRIISAEMASANSTAVTYPLTMLPMVARLCIWISAHSSTISFATSVGAGSRKFGISSARVSTCQSTTRTITSKKGPARSAPRRQLRATGLS